MADLYTSFCEPVNGLVGPLTKVLPVKSTDLAKVKSGVVCTIDEHGYLVAGRASGDHKQMPLFVFRGVESPSVYDSMAGPGNWVDGAWPMRVFAMAFPATCGLELQTSYFDSSQTYDPNDLLTYTHSNDAKPGRLTNQNVTLYTTVVCCVSSVHENAQNYDNNRLGVLFGGADEPTGVATGKNANGVTVLTFWPVYLPGTSTSG